MFIVQVKFVLLFAIIVHTPCHLFQGICFQIFWDLAARSTCWTWSVHTFPWEMPSGVLPSTNQAHIFTLHLHCVNPCSVSLHYLLFKDFGNIYLQVIMWIFKLITESTEYSAFTCLKVSFCDGQKHSHHCMHIDITATGHYDSLLNRNNKMTRSQVVWQGREPVTQFVPC